MSCPGEHRRSHVLAIEGSGPPLPRYMLRIGRRIVATHHTSPVLCSPHHADTGRNGAARTLQQASNASTSSSRTAL